MPEVICAFPKATTHAISCFVWRARLGVGTGCSSNSQMDKDRKHLVQRVEANLSPNNALNSDGRFAAAG